MFQIVQQFVILRCKSRRAAAARRACVLLQRVPGRLCVRQFFRGRAADKRVAPRKNSRREIPHGPVEAKSLAFGRIMGSASETTRQSLTTHWVRCADFYNVARSCRREIDAGNRGRAAD